MFLTVQPLTDASSWERGVSSWARGSGLEIVLIVLGTILLTRLATWLGGRITGRIDANAREADALVRSEASKHRHALAQVITWATLVIIYCVAAVAIAARLNIPLTSLVAPAAVAGVALGFGAQRIVQDILAGFFIITERQYGFGDLIRLSVPSIPDPAIGTVEDVTLRVTTVRTIDGEVVITPNGQITQVTNLSRDWARAVVDVPVPAASDVNRVSDLLRLIGEEAYKEPELRTADARSPDRHGRAEHRHGPLPDPPVDQDLARQAVRRRADPARPDRGRAPGRGHPLAGQHRYGRADRGRLMRRVRRVRTSTWILTAVFLVTLVTWVLVMPTQPRNRRHPLDDGAALDLVRAGPGDVTGDHHADAHADEFGVPDWHITSGPLTDGDAVRGSHAVRGSDANSLSHRFGAALAGPPTLSCGAPVGDGADDDVGAGAQDGRQEQSSLVLQDPVTPPAGLDLGDAAAGPGSQSAAGRAAAPRGRIRRSCYGDGSADPRPAATAAGRRRRPASR